MTKSRIVGVMLILFVGFLILRPGDEPADKGDRGDESESAIDRHYQPREPAFMKPSRDYGIAEQSGTSATPPSYGMPGTYHREQLAQHYPDGNGFRVPYGGEPRISTNGYRFRPLGEKERQRIQKGYPEQYQQPYYAPPGAHPRTTAPSSYSGQPRYSQPQQPNYGLRPLDRSQTARGRWQGPYQTPDWNSNQPPVDPWTSPPDPQWGSMPPYQRMYPNLYRRSDRRLTAR